MTKKKTTKPYPIEYVPNGDGEKEYRMDVWRITRQMRRLADAARSAGKRWDHLMLQVDEKTIVLAMIEISSDSFGVYLAWAEFQNDDQKNLAVKRLRRELPRWIKEHGFTAQPVKQLEQRAQ